MQSTICRDAEHKSSYPDWYILELLPLSTFNIVICVIYFDNFIAWNLVGVF